jgi:outer membrane protein OmpA-like peptidoglycan-associated protein
VPSNSSLTSSPTVEVTKPVNVKSTLGVLFSTGITKLSSAQKAQIKKFASALGASKLAVKVVGNTKGIKKTSSNTAIARARAEVVLAYLKSLRVPAKFTSGYLATGTSNAAVILATWQK